MDMHTFKLSETDGYSVGEQLQRCLDGAKEANSMADG